MTESRDAKAVRKDIARARDDSIVQKALETYGVEELRAMYELSRRDEEGKLLPFYGWTPYSVAAAPFNGESPQEECIRSKAKRKIFMGGNRAGKTELMVHQFVSYGMGFEPFTGIRYDTQGEVGWLCTEPDFVESLFDRLIAHAPADEVDIRRSPGRYTMRFKKTGFLIRMKSFAQPATQYESERVYAIGSDEEMPEHLFQAARTRIIDRHGIMLFTLTPVLGTVYLSDISMGFDEKHERAEGGKCAWWQLRMEDNPHLPKEAIADYKADFLGDDEEYRIRVEGEYIARVGNCPFNDYLRTMGDATEEPLGWFRFDEDGELVPEQDGFGWVLWQEPKPGYAYGIGADPGGDTPGGKSNSAAWIVEAPTGKYVGSFAHRLPPIDFAEELMMAGRAYNQALLGPEGNNSMGGVVCQRLIDASYPNLYMRTYFGSKMNGMVKDVVGWKTDMQSKRLLVEEWCYALNRSNVWMPDGETVNEMRTFTRYKKSASGTYGFGPSSTRHRDDRVMAAMIAWQIVKQQRAYVDDSPESRYRRMTTTALEMACAKHNEQFENPDAWFGV